ncbi:hypothetical protein V496_05970 [Pseudogymnoascus sp. VKM F-4515 (FW-2607)]|nr:hypothetical protein V496_05970 [Pseudogymnoascus sp. VKM F-4515 (FW-2607)]KFY90402.1 hypothetical protein V498_05996 [Pseudogymnoascus sp. VKM F-4517 (FW-2822)]
MGLIALIQDTTQLVLMGSITFHGYYGVKANPDTPPGANERERTRLYSGWGVVVYNDGIQSSTDAVVPTGEAAGVVDSKGNVVLTSNNAVQFGVSSPGVIVATDNGFNGDLTKSPFTKRNAFDGLALAIVRSELGKGGYIKISTTSDVKGAEIAVTAKTGRVSELDP